MVDYNPRLEYKEEKGVSGFLFMFVVLMAGVEIFLFIYSIAAAQIYFKSIDALRTVSLVIGIAFIAYIIFTIITLYLIPRIAVVTSKSYLVARLAYLIPVTIITYITSLNDPEFTEASMGTKSVVQTTGYVLVLEMAYLLSFSVLWYIYFRRSKRIKEYYINIK